MAWSKESRHARGYGTAWDKVREQIMRRDCGLCQCDRCKGGDLRLTLATEVHHIVSKAKAKTLGWTQEQIDAPSNLMAVAEDCHKRITQIENGAKPRPEIGPDGWPLP